MREMCTHRPPPANNNITVARFFAKIIIIIPDPPVYNIIIYYTCTYNVTFYRVGSYERMIVTAVENGNNRGIPTTIQRRGTIFSSRTVCARGRCNSVIYGVLSPERQNFLFFEPDWRVSRSTRNIALPPSLFYDIRNTPVKQALG